MFTGVKRKTSNFRVMQIFHELKAQYPTIPDHILNSCITSHIVFNSPENIYDFLAQQHSQMGRPSLQHETTPLVPTPEITQHPIELHETTNPQFEGSRVDFERLGDMDSVSDTNHNLVKASDVNSEFNKPAGPIRPQSIACRPNTLNIKASPNNPFDLRLSEKCQDVHKLLNSPVLSEKPPRSPLGSKRLPSKPPAKRDSPASSPTQGQQPAKKETVSTPTQTTDTLVNNIVSPSLNLSLNVNCQMGLVQSPTKSKCSTSVELTPAQPWLNPNTFLNDPSTSPRSFTSVNLTLRPPSVSPQEPIDIMSQNSSLTYSTSSFDRQKGLQSRLQITVGPGNANSVSSVRTRPRSFHVEESPGVPSPLRAGSLNDLPVVSCEIAPVLLKQQARIDNMQIEIRTANAKLVIMKQEVEELEKRRQQIAEKKSIAEMEKQLQREIKHLTVQCEQLFDKDEFYNNIYTGPTGPLLTPQPQITNIRPPVNRRSAQSRTIYQSPSLEIEGPKWNCSLCTFLNHPDLDRCEQCEMPRVYHGRNSSLTLDALKSIPNSTRLDAPFNMLKKSANALKKTFKQAPQRLSPLTTNYLSSSDLMKINDNSNNNNYPIVPSVSAPSVIAISDNSINSSNG